MLDKPRPARPMIGYLTTGVGPGVGLAVWLGVVDAAREHGANLFTFVGGALRDPVVFGSQANILYGLPTARRADGLVIWGSSIGGFVDREEIAALCKRYTPLPLVNITLPMPGIPTLLIDSYRSRADEPHRFPGAARARATVAAGAYQRPARRSLFVERRNARHNAVKYLIHGQSLYCVSMNPTCMLRSTAEA